MVHLGVGWFGENIAGVKGKAVRRRKSKNPGRTHLLLFSNSVMLNVLPKSTRPPISLNISSFNSFHSRIIWSQVFLLFKKTVLFPGTGVEGPRSQLLDQSSSSSPAWTPLSIHHQKRWEFCVWLFFFHTGPRMQVFSAVLCLRMGGRMKSYNMVLFKVRCSTVGIKEELEMDDNKLWRKWLVFLLRNTTAQTGHIYHGEAEKDPKSVLEMIACKG